MSPVGATKFENREKERNINNDATLFFLFIFVKYTLTRYALTPWFVQWPDNGEIIVVRNSFRHFF